MVSLYLKALFQLVLVLFGTTLLGSSYAHASAVTISDTATYAQIPDVAVDANGVSASVFVQGSQIFANVKSGSGAWLASPVQASTVSSPAFGVSNFPKVRALNGGGFVVAWVQKNSAGDAWGVSACKLDAATAVCSSPVAVFGTPVAGGTATPQNEYNQTDMALAVDTTSGKVFVVDSTAGFSGWSPMTAASSADGGLTWSTPVTMSDPGSGGMAPPRPSGMGGLGAAATSGKLIALAANANAMFTIAAWTFDPTASSGSEWTASSLSGSMDTMNSTPFSVSARGANVLAIWRTSMMGGLTWAASTDSGFSWASGGSFSGSLDGTVGPVAQITSQGRMLLAWNKVDQTLTTPLDRIIQGTFSDDNGSTWSTVEDLLTYPSNAGVLVNRGLLAASNTAGDATVAWAFSNPNNKIAARTLPHGASPVWETESVLYPSTAIVDYFAGLAGGGTGLFTLIWTENNQPSYSTSYIKSLGYNFPAGPALSATAVTATGATTADLKSTSSAGGTGYWVVLPSGATAPSAAQVKLGQDSSSAAVASGKSGSATMVAATEKTFSLTGLTASTSYEVCLMVEDSTPTQSAVSCANVTTQAVPDSTAPTTSAVSASATGQTTADLLGTSDEVATGYWVVLPGPSATPPTAVQVEAGQDSSGNAVASGKSGSDAMTAATPKTFAITGLTASTAYTLCVMAKDASGNRSTVTCSDITTQAVPDTTPPTTSAVSASATGQTTANLLGTSDEAATGYWVVLPGPSATPPTAAQVELGQDSASSAVASGKSGNASMTAATAKTFAITGLTASTSYTICLMAKDAAGNRSAVTCSDITTQAIPLPTVGSISPTSGSTAGGTNVTITGANLTGASAVTIGGNACASVTVVSATSITCFTPAGSAGAASVLVTTPGGTNSANTLFTYSVNANGGCGGAQGQAVSIAPTQNLCTTGAASSVVAAVGGFSWSCAGVGSGAPASCTAPGTTAPGSTATTTTELVSGTGCRFSTVTPLAPPNGGPGGGVTMPYGVVDFTLLDCTAAQATVRMTYSGPVGNMTLWKYGPYPTPTSAVSWYQLSGATVSGNSITFTVQDNGPGDSDPATGVIADPAGPGSSNALAGQPTSIPTLSEWGMILMSGLLGLFGMAQMRRRR